MTSTIRRRCLFTAAVLAASVGAASSQQISISDGIRVAGLWCFPLVSDSTAYYYLSNRAHLALSESGDPAFSLIRYVINTPGEVEEGHTVTQASGGAVLHFLVTYDTDPEQVSDAEAVLRDRLKNDDIALRGPMIFDAGRYVLVSSILNPETGESERHALATGQAPVLEGSRLALSFELDPERSNLLLRSFQMATPDVSIVFELQFSGISDGYEAELFIDWSEVRKSEAFGAGASIYFIGADVETSFDRLRRDNAIQLRTIGSDASMEGLLETVYSKLLELMFRPVQIDRVPEDQKGGLMDAIGALVDPKGPLSSRNTTGFGLNASFQLKDLRSTGTTTLNFNSRAAVDRTHYVTFNIGDLYRHYGDNPKFFRTVALDDPDFEQRRIFVGVDGSLVQEFDKMINSVTVTLRKEHQNGQETVRELVVDRQTFTDSTRLEMVYGSRADTNRIAWLNYEYRTGWKFQKGGGYQTSWLPESASMINLFAPYERRTVQLLGDTESLASLGVRAIVVKIDYPFFGERRSAQVVVKPGDNLAEKEFQITLPINEYEYDYTVTWFMDGGDRRVASGKDTSGLVFIDELPES